MVESIKDDEVGLYADFDNRARHASLEGLDGIENRRFARFQDIQEAAHRGRGVERHAPADDEPVEQMAQRSEAFFHCGRGQLARLPASTLYTISSESFQAPIRTSGVSNHADRV